MNIKYTFEFLIDLFQNNSYSKLYESPFRIIGEVQNYPPKFHFINPGEKIATRLH